jgi:hypothetical protein
VRGATEQARWAERRYSPNGELSYELVELAATGFLPASSTEALKARGADLRAMRIHGRTNLSLDDLARWLNPIVRGWMNYYGRFYRSAMAPLLLRVSAYLRRWAGKKYRRLRTYHRFKRWWAGLLERDPGLFAHWRWVRAY